MIRKKHARGPRADGWEPGFARDKCPSVCPEIMLKQKADSSLWNLSVIREGRGNFVVRSGAAAPGTNRIMTG
jgi:hypothetical protein